MSENNSDNTDYKIATRAVRTGQIRSQEGEQQMQRQSSRVRWKVIYIHALPIQQYVHLKKDSRRWKKVSAVLRLQQA